MPWESIGSISSGNMPHDEEWIVWGLNIAKKYVELVCGKAPEGSGLDIMWEDSDLGNYPSLGIWFEFNKPSEYINNCEDALNVFDASVSWTDLKSHIEGKYFIDKKKDHYIHTNKATDVKNAEYFIALCKEQRKQDSVPMYYGYFINNTSMPIDIMLEIPPATLTKIKPGSTINDLINISLKEKSINLYENIPPHGDVELNMIYFEWEFDFSNTRHLFLQTLKVEKHINFCMKKYFISQNKIDCIPILNRDGYVCLPNFSN